MPASGTGEVMFKIDASARHGGAYRHCGESYRRIGGAQQTPNVAVRRELTIPVGQALKLSQLGEAQTLLAGGRVGSKIIVVP